MKNVTVSLEDDVAQWARVWAAKHDTSVSRMLGQMLKEHMRETNHYSAAMQDFLSVDAESLRKPGERLPGRDEVHERD